MNCPMHDPEANLSSQVCELLYDLAKTRNGENVVIDLNGVPVLVVQRLEDADQILRLNANNYRKNMAWFRQALGASRFSEDGKAWEIRRDLTQSYLSRFDRERAFDFAARYGRMALDRMIARSAEGVATLDDDALREMMANIVVDNFLHVKFADTGIDLGVLAQLMERGSEYSFVPAGQTNALYRKHLATLPALRRRVLDMLGFFRKGDVPHTPIYDGIVAADKDPANDIVLEHELMTFLASGAETSAATTGWASWLLAMHPDEQEELRQAAQAFWASDDRSWAALNRLRPFSAFISEVLRLYPPTPIIARLANAADRLGEMDVAADQNVLISFIGIQHDRRHRADPWSLDIGEEADKPASGTHSAFSFGPRVCGGKQFALVELATVLSVFVANARFEPTSTEPPTFRWKSQMLRQGGHPVRVLPLTGAQAHGERQTAAAS